jgi:hypothetical protein
VTSRAGELPRGTIVACPTCGRRLKIAAPTIAAACPAYWNTKLPKTHPVTQMRPVEDATSSP